jgi:L-histidine N-alpha-methyltransferase
MMEQDFQLTSPRINDDLVRGLSDIPRWLPYRLLWDEYNSSLYDEIRDQPEYYLNRLETELLTLHAADIMAASAALGLLELGPGSGEKALILLRHMQHPAWFTPMDICPTALAALDARLRAEAPKVAIHPLCADFTLPWPSDLNRAPGPLLTAFLGGTLGNFLPEERRAFLANLARGLREGDMFLTGVPLVTAEDEMRNAYNDKAGLMVEFYRHCLCILNRDWCTDFNEDGFDHHVTWSAESQRVEVGLRARMTQNVHVPGIATPLTFRRGEVLRAVVAARFTADRILDELASHGFEAVRWVVEDSDRYALALVRKARQTH